MPKSSVTTEKIFFSKKKIRAVIQRLEEFMVLLFNFGENKRKTQNNKKTKSTNPKPNKTTYSFKHFGLNDFS